LADGIEIVTLENHFTPFIIEKEHGKYSTCFDESKTKLTIYIIVARGIR